MAPRERRHHTIRSAARVGRSFAPALLAAAGLLLGGVLAAFDQSVAARVSWGAATLLVAIPTLLGATRRLLEGESGVDWIALLAMGGALALGEFLVAAIIALMLAGGASLERYAVGRARRELTALLEHAPKRAHRIEDGATVEIDVAEVRPGDLLLVKPGEVIPADGVLLDDSAVLDESALTGESRPTLPLHGSYLRSGGLNSGPAFRMRASVAADQSTYAGIARLVRSAAEQKPHFVRLADRYAGWFFWLVLVVAGGAWWASGSAHRALAVLVVATPCPLILAAPAAIVSGISRAARTGIVIKGGDVLERLARTQTILLDKTGTITSGRPRVASIEPLGVHAPDELLRMAAALEQVSVHPFAPSIVAEARRRALTLPFPDEVTEPAGVGIRGRVEGHQVRVGLPAFVLDSRPPPPEGEAIARRASLEGSSVVFIAIDGELAGALVLQDPIRTEAPRALRSLRRFGIERMIMLTGDQPDVAELVGDAVGVDEVLAGLSPADKVEAITRAGRSGVTLMVGDGVNDAPALALADIGAAMGARGAAAAAEAADVVFTSDRLDSVVEALAVARRTRAIALQSVLAGMGMSLVAMLAAALGYLPPIVGAVLQEGIDLAVILNALRALAPGHPVHPVVKGHDALSRELASVHQRLVPGIEGLATLASQLDALPRARAKRELERTRDFLVAELLPHEAQEQQSAFPLLERALGGEDPVGPLVQTHHEVARLVRLFDRLVRSLPAEGPAPEDLPQLRRMLYGAHAILSLHFSQEEEAYLRLGGWREANA